MFDVLQVSAISSGKTKWMFERVMSLQQLSLWQTANILWPLIILFPFVVS